LIKEQARVSMLIIFDIPNNKRLSKIQEFGNERYLSVNKWKKLIKESNLQIIEISGRRFNKVFKFFSWLTDKEIIRRVFGTSSIFVCRSIKF
jgi:hypothetical protein